MRKSDGAAKIVWCRRRRTCGGVVIGVVRKEQKVENGSDAAQLAVQNACLCIVMEEICERFAETRML